jgi:O-antigen ligase
LIYIKSLFILHQKLLLSCFSFSFAVISVFHLAYCIAQRAYGVDWGHGLHAVLGPGRYAYGVYRVSGFLGHPLTLGYSQLLALVGCSAFYTIADNRSEKNAWLVGLLSALILILMSGSRGPQILAVAIILMSIPREIIFMRWRFLSIIAVILAAFALWIGAFSRFEELFNNGLGGDARYTHWTVYWRIFNDHKLHGIGPGAPEQAISAYYFKAGADDTIKLAHNAFLQCAAEYGVLGLSGMLFWIFSWVRVGCAVKYVKKGIFGLLFILVLGGVTQNTIQDSEFVLSLTIWTMLLVAKEVDLSGIAAGRAKTKDLVS